MRTGLFDFELPEARIAFHPASPRTIAAEALHPFWEACVFVGVRT